jgi:predicted transcriptional regulator YheO
MSTDSEHIHPVLKAVMQVVPGLAETLGDGVEVLVNEFSHPEDAMLAIGGSITGRQPGAPLSDMVLKLLRQGKLEEDMINYHSRTPDGRELRSSTILLRDDEGKVLGCL